MRTFKIPKTDRAVVDKISLLCPECGNEAIIPIYEKPLSAVIAAIGFSLIFEDPQYEPPLGFMPDSVTCRECKSTFED